MSSIHLTANGERASYNADGSTKQLSLEHIIVDESDRNIAKADYLTFLNAVEDSLPLQEYDIEPNGNTKASWIGKVIYSDSGKKTENQVLNGGGVIERFEISSRSVRIMNAPLDAKFPAAAPDFKDLINVNTDGTVQGAEIEVAELGFTVTKQYDNTAINAAFKAKLMSAMNKVNSVAFRDYGIGTVRMNGLSDSDAGSDKTRILYRFSALENKTNFPVGDVTGVNKKGHEFLWVRYKEERDVATKVITKVPEFVYVHKPYLTFDFNDATLGIG